MRSNLIARCLIAFVLLTVAGCGSKSRHRTPNQANSPIPRAHRQAQSPDQPRGNNRSDACCASASSCAATSSASGRHSGWKDAYGDARSNGELEDRQQRRRFRGFVGRTRHGGRQRGSSGRHQSFRNDRARTISGQFNGHALLQLTLDSIRFNGTRYSIQTSEFEDVGKGRGKRTAIGAGGGAAFGAIVGALAGGGKGAAIGAVAGGGAGTAGAGFTGKKDIVLPAETRLHFKLAQPVSVAVSQ